MSKLLTLFFGVTIVCFGTTNYVSAQNNSSKKTTIRLPEVCKLPKEIDETSGLIYWRHSLWTHNDSGGLPVIYKIDTLSGKILQRITLKNATNHDWEDITQDKTYIYVGDIGNNSGNRTDLAIYKIKKQNIPPHGDATVSAEKISYTYPDKKIEIHNRRQNNFDCEALMAKGDSLYLFSKNWGNQQTRVYVLPKMPGNYLAHRIARYNIKGLVTGADYNDKTGKIVLVGYTRGNWVPFIVLLQNYKDDKFFGGNVERIKLKVKATQIEGVAFADGDKIYLSSEGRVPVFKQALYKTSVEQLQKTYFSSQKKRKKQGGK